MGDYVVPGEEPAEPGIYRSEKMCLAQLYLQSDASYQCVAELGELGLVQFRDLNPDVSSFQRKYVNEVRRCDEMERKLRFLEREIKKDQIPMLDTGENPDAPLPREMIDLEATFEKLENELREVNRNEETLKKNFSELTELKHILRKTQTFFEEVEHDRWRPAEGVADQTRPEDSQPLIDVDDEDNQGVSLAVASFASRLRLGRPEQAGSGDTIIPPATGGGSLDLGGEESLELTQQLTQGGAGAPAGGTMFANFGILTLILLKTVACVKKTNMMLTRDAAINSSKHEDLIAESASVTGPLDDELDISHSQPDAHMPLKLQLRFVAGVIQRERLPAFERLLWRACRGNVFLRTSEIDDVLNDTVTGEPVNKTVFIIFFQGEQLKTKVKKICEGFRATLYPCPDTPQERREMSIGVMTRIEDLKTVLGQTQDHRHRVLVAASKNVRMWLTKVRKIKSIYHTLNLFNIDVTQKCLIAEVWCPVDELDRIKMALKRGTEESGSQVPSILNRMESAEAPPTYNKTNKFTRGFQNIVDAYGIATYREINPAPYTMVSFPFLFAVMFGDMGHGVIMFLAALFFILKEKQLEAARIKDEIFQTFFGGRYVIVLMGLFSIYTGFIYNDIFLQEFQYAEKRLMLIPELAFDGSPYPIGVDPAWNLAEANKLSFLNSMKMKMSVILGITQMTFGLLLSYKNHKYFKSDLDIKFMFIPQMIFLSSIFIYLCLQIVAKWLFFTAEGGTVLGYTYPGSSCAPSLLVGLINMFMIKSRAGGFVAEDGSTLDLCYLNLWYPGQSFFETVFVLLALACLPVMLFAKPYMLWKEEKQRREVGHRQLGIIEMILVILAVVQVPIMLFAKPFFVMRRAKHQTAYSTLHNEFDRESVRADMNGDDAEVVHAPIQAKPEGHGHGHGDGPLEMGDVMVYQAIHTIEFALGCISHTASYLRLWALSLAHAQLSDVLWTMVFRHAFTMDGYSGAIATYLLFFVFGFLSVFILVLMEGLSAFLHALRLHWVEFQSKFYGGQGYEFLPFSFEKILAEERAAEERAEEIASLQPFNQLFVIIRMKVSCVVFVNSVVFFVLLHVDVRLQRLGGASSSYLIIDSP
ncbi:unnamed protein product [Caenorhabditis auriculariae]|uniref:V-type proton ATPase subunit a n=1 Tax=Caenorhabditis auriculariae TaxID=2777116 RepID=A0A8S1HPH1_9PELO|nr:unnamed protein product [Caenorhabditis auriculariae]